MKDVFLVGVGQVPVREHWKLSLRELGARAAIAAMTDAGVDRVDAVVVGNMLGSRLGHQDNLGSVIADAAGLLPCEAWRVEAACASGGLAVRAAAMAISSGGHDTVMAVGLEKMTDAGSAEVTAALAAACDHEYEAAQGFTFPGIAGLVMRRYLHEVGCGPEAFAPFVLAAHEHGRRNTCALYRKGMTLAEWQESPKIASPLRLLDCAPVCDGAAAVILCSERVVRSSQKALRVAASTVACDTIDLASRKDLLTLGGAVDSATRAYRIAGVKSKQISLFEAHDAFSPLAVLSLEACGFARRGEGIRLGASGAIRRDGSIPLGTFGGLKARGHPVGASGTYQVVEAALQLRGEAGENQIVGAKYALTQSIGGYGATVVTHILEV